MLAVIFWCSHSLSGSLPLLDINVIFNNMRIPEEVWSTTFPLESAFPIGKMAELSNPHSSCQAACCPSACQSAFGPSQLFHHHRKERVLQHEASPNKAAISKTVIYIKTDFHKCKLKNRTMNKQSSFSFMSAPVLDQENILNYSKKVRVKNSLKDTNAFQAPTTLPCSSSQKKRLRCVRIEPFS